METLPQGDGSAAVQVKTIATCIGFIMASCTNTSEAPFVDAVAEAMANEGKVNVELLEWTRDPQGFEVKGDTLIITTAPHTDLWQRTYYHFRNDNAPVLQMKTREKYFSFISSDRTVRNMVRNRKG